LVEITEHKNYALFLNGMYVDDCFIDSNLLVVPDSVSYLDVVCLLHIPLNTTKEMVSTTEQSTRRKKETDAKDQ
jgi:hypothetical protein